MKNKSTFELLKHAPNLTARRKELLDRAEMLSDEGFEELLDLISLKRREKLTIIHK